MTPATGRRRALATTACAASLIVATPLLCAPAHEPQPRRRATPPSVIDGAATARPTPPHAAVPGAAQRAAERFAADYSATLTGARKPHEIRHATGDLRRRIAAAGLHIDGRAGQPQIELRLRRITSELAAATGTARVGDRTIHLAFVIAHAGRSWVVGEIGEPDDTTAQ